MLGHVSSTGAVIWVNATRPARVSVSVGREASLGDGRVVAGPLLSPEAGLMGTTPVAGLEPSTRYYYCVLLDGRPAWLPPYPSFTTAPPEGASGRVRFAFVSCLGYRGEDSSAGFADLTRTNIDFVLLLGDNVYSNTNEPAVIRRFHQEQRRSAGWAGVGPVTPMYAIWDDHDYGPDNSDGRMPGKEKALEAFRQVWANPGGGEADNPGIYFKFSRRDVDFFMLDGRYHRDPNKAAVSGRKTMLGVRQLEWLKRELAASRARIKVLVSGGEWQAHGTQDSWKSFQAERDELFRFIEERAIQGVLLLSGDRHYTGAYHVEGKWIEVTTGPLGSDPIVAKNAPESFLNYSAGRGHYYCIYDFDTAMDPPRVTLEVWRVGDGRPERRTFSWDEVTGAKRIAPLPATAR
ncbi:MAG: hypothetical protein RJA22_1466 [Verrucomicrobiota bacterium]